MLLYGTAKCCYRTTNAVIYEQQMLLYGTAKCCYRTTNAVIYEQQMLLYGPHLFVLAEKISKRLNNSNFRRIQCLVIPNRMATLQLSK